jgi:hypothetical protein
MSENLDRPPPPAPKTERWVIMMVCAFAPAVTALFVPESARVALFVASAAIFIVSFVIMIRNHRRERDERR